MRVDELVSGVKSQIALKVFGDDLDTLVDLGEQMAAVLKSVPGAVDVKVEAVEGLGYLQITMHRRRLARLGLSVAQVRELIEIAMGGRVVTTVPEGERRTDVVVRLPQEFTFRVENLRRLPLFTPRGERVLLEEVASLDLVEGPAQISRENGKRRLVVEMNVVGRDIGGFVAEARRRIADEVALPTGYHTDWGGQFEQQQRAMARLQLDGAAGAGADLHPALPQLPPRAAGAADPGQHPAGAGRRRDRAEAVRDCTCRSRRRWASSRCSASPSSTAW